MNIHISGPCEVRERFRKERDVICGNVVEEEANNEVVNEVRERADERTIETMGWNGFLYVRESEWWFFMGNST
ncbi:hypothetical protein Q8G45_28865, partial [Klebsiella pneumoniae]